MDEVKYKTSKAEIVANVMNIALERGVSSTDVFETLKTGGEIYKSVSGKE
jgi:DUF2075 family protein